MSRVLLSIVVVAFFAVQLGCGRAARDVAKAAAKRITSQATKQGGKQAEKGAVKSLEKQAARQFEASALRQGVVGVERTALRSVEVLSHSQSLGRRLPLLKPKIPPVVYARLFQQWQNNNAEIEACHERLKSPALDSHERKNVQERLVAASERNTEIERLMAQYG